MRLRSLVVFGGAVRKGLNDLYVNVNLSAVDVNAAWMKKFAGIGTVAARLAGGGGGSVTHVSSDTPLPPASRAAKGSVGSGGGGF